MSPNHDDGHIESIDSIDNEQADNAIVEYTTAMRRSTRAMKRVSPTVVIENRQRVIKHVELVFVNPTNTLNPTNTTQWVMAKQGVLRDFLK